MFLLEVLLIGIILSADSFSIALAMGHRPFTQKDAFRFAFASGSAEALVTVVGALAGSQIISRFEAIDHWVAFGLLMAVALHMAYEGIEQLRNKEDTSAHLEFHSFLKIIVVSFATSLDALGFGIGLGISGKPLLSFVVAIGLCAFIATLLGLHLAKKLSAKFGPIMNLVGALVLGVMAFQMLGI
jgi:putative Mn2+ efflux pump MntP